ncbi:MAG: hypothetical protein M1834_002077 [Cirrosporium novae-zelandiae]|nr:MAG: hypothetical protein M1834_002077 [Cirrosporium novae-zelandiae]
MATAEAATRPHDRHTRRRPFSSWMKRLTNLKTASADHTPGKRTLPLSKTRKSSGAKNNPYPLSGRVNDQGSTNGNNRLAFSTPPSRSSESGSSSRRSAPGSADGHPPPTIGNKSCAPTLATNPDTIQSETARSKAGTSATVGVSTKGGGEGSTFSSPAPSERSLTTTLTTVHSAAVSAMLPPGNGQGNGTIPIVNHNGQHSQQQSVTFSHQFPTNTTPASAVPAHLAPHGTHPMTYASATANNVLNDNASILTLASSSKRGRRRNSLDTNASIRALAPSSIFGGSRESLPLSTLSGTPAEGVGPSTVQAGRPSLGGIANTERTSVYSSSGVAPALSSERNSYYANKQVAGGDGGSVRSGRAGHGRNDSLAGSSIHGTTATTSPLTSPIPRDIAGPGRGSRRSSGLGEVPGEEVGGEEEKPDGAIVEITKSNSSKDDLKEIVVKEE